MELQATGTFLCNVAQKIINEFMQKERARIANPFLRLAMRVLAYMRTYIQYVYGIKSNKSQENLFKKLEWAVCKYLEINQI